MYSIIQKIYEKQQQNFKRKIKKSIIRRRCKFSLTVAIKEFTDVLEKELFSEIAHQLDEIIFEDNKKKKQYDPVKFQEKNLITKNGKAKFKRRYYQDKKTGEYIYLTDAVLGIDKGKRIDKKVKSEVIERADDQSYNQSGKMVVPELEISITTVIRIDEVQQVRKELVDKFTFSGLYKDNQKLWEDVAYYIDCTYKKDEIENIFIMGNGASYIKAGVE